jgi:heterodisulfide reductase subunit D
VRCQKIIEETKEHLKLLGIDERRLQVTWISSSEGAEFAEELCEFDQLLQELGKSPVTENREWGSKYPIKSDKERQEEGSLQVTKEQVAYCMECSICTGTCPVSRENPRFSPKQMINRASMGLDHDILKSREVWACLSCAQCNVRCPAMIDIAEFNRSYRFAAREAGNLPVESHHGIQQSVSRLQRHPVRQKRTAWAEQAGKFKQNGDYFYFVGCLPFFDITFRYLGISSLNSARSVLTLLNRIGIEPVISNDERCCGHDALCSGDENTFRELALWNLEVIRESGAKTVLFSCPEGYSTFKYLYPRFLGELPFEVIHLTEFFLDKIPDTGVVLKASHNGAVTFQDPCRLGRWAEIYDAPRGLIRLVPGTDIIEMERNRENALCCGTSAWMECSSYSKAIQIERLIEAQQTGAKELITACPKCLVHLTCAQSNEDVDIRVSDIYTHISECIEGGKNILHYSLRYSYR